jgi:hypothetical protein
MSKFTVGEICLHRGTGHLPLEEYGETPWAVGERCRILKLHAPNPEGFLYEIESLDEPGWFADADDSDLRKLPGDSNETEDPGVTRLKKLLKQDVVKQPKTKVTQ